MTDKTKYYIWLSLGIGFASRKSTQIYSAYENEMEQLYEGGERELRYYGIFSEQEIERLLHTDISAAEKIINNCKELGYEILDISESKYPHNLRSIEDAPLVLYVDGKMPPLDKIYSVSIIGTRKATVYGIRTAFELGANLSKKGICVVSGGALGIDCAAHRGVLHVAGRTVCVLGCGLDVDYLRENKAMRKQITEKGAVISEYPPGTPVSAHNFPQRNRIISGLTYGTVVVEAPLRSGSMITVNFALEQCRDVFAVMGNIDSPYSEGTNALIKEGAIPVTSYKDIAEYYLDVDDRPDKPVDIPTEAVLAVPNKLKTPVDTTKTDNTPVPVHKENLTLSDEEKTVYYLIGQEPIHVDKIAEMSALPTHKVLRIISSLEIRDLIKNIEGRNYVLN